MTQWRTARLGEVVTFRRGYDLPYRKRRSGVVPVISSAGHSDWHDTALVDPPGVVTGRYGTIGNVFYVSDPYWPLNTTLYVRNFHENDPRFIYYHLQRFDYASFSGKSGVPGVNRNDLHAETVTLPVDVWEQRAIAEALSDVDALLGALDRLIAKKRDLKQAAMQQLLTGRTRLPGFSGEWETRSFQDVCQKIQDGTHFSPKLGGNDFLYVTSKNIRWGKLDLSSAERISASEHSKIYARCDVKKGDLLLTKDGANTGNAALNHLTEPFSLLSSVAMLRFDDKCHSASYYMYQVLSDDGQRQIMEAMSGNAITRLTLKKIRALRFLSPTFLEQAAIADVLASMDSELASLDQRREKTRALKQGMMQELLTGRTRLV